ncbi:MAG: BREX-4 system phosphatase PglZ [Lachnospiraceae bacterium]
MIIFQIDYADLLNEIVQDTVQKRFNAKVFLVNNFTTYFKLVHQLEDLADRTIHISDPMYCLGEDTIPDMKKVLATLNECGEKNVLITSLGEYLRFGSAVENNGRHIFSIISRQAHSSKRVWMPIYAAKDEFLTAVGELDDEHYPQVVYEVNDLPSGFEVTVYAKNFSQTPGLVTVSGIREWLNCWDNYSVQTGMSIATRHAQQVKESDGLYSIQIITEPFQFFKSRIYSDLQIDSALGTESEWLHLAQSVTKQGTPIQDAIKGALNLINFEPHQIICGWETADDNTKWLFWLWYHLGLNNESDYISHAVSSANSFDEIEQKLENDILSCTDNPNFDNWVTQRNNVMSELSRNTFSNAFWQEFDAMQDYRKQLKILSGRTHDERTKIIEVVSKALCTGKKIHDFKLILADKYPDLYTYLSHSEYGYEDLQAYISQYKLMKIMDEFSLSISDSAEGINFFDYDSRGKILNGIKNDSDAFYLWVDGMGIEWIDLLVKKIAEADAGLSAPRVSIGTAVLPTVTSVNMACADPETVSLKLNDLDSLGHIKDKSNCNYFSVVAKQIELITSVAQDVVRLASERPGKDIVITADHGMSRLAAKGFHQMEGVKPQKNAEVCSLGRYCQFSEESSLPDVSHTIKGDSVVAFRTHGHFAVSGYAPGEIHGGATPEEILVPIIHYKKTGTSVVPVKAQCSYTIEDTVARQPSGMSTLHVKTQGPVSKVIIEVQSKRIVAKKNGENDWIVNIPDLLFDHNYQIRVYLNNIFTDKEETIYVKVPGMTVTDEL